MPAAITYSLGLNAGPLVRGFGLAKGAVQGFGGVVDGLKVQLSGALAAVGGLGGLIREALSSAAADESTNVAFETLIGSATVARKTLGDLKRFADTTPYEFPELAGAAKKLLAMGSAAKDVTGELRMLGDIGSLLEQPIGDLADLFGKARTQGRLMAEDVNQLTGRGIPVIQEFARQFGVGTGEVRKLVETGKIGFEQLNVALKSLTTEGGRFFGGMERQSQTALGKWSTFGDAVKSLLREFGKPILQELKITLTAATNLAASLVTKAKEWGQAVATALGVIRELFNSGRLGSALGNGLKVVLGEAVNYFVKAMGGAVGAIGGMLYGALKGAITAALTGGEFGGMATVVKEATDGFKAGFDAVPNVVNTTMAKVKLAMDLGPAMGKVRSAQAAEMAKAMLSQVSGFFQSGAALGEAGAAANALAEGKKAKDGGRLAVDRLAQIGGFIGTAKAVDRTAEQQRQKLVKSAAEIAANTKRKGRPTFGG